MDLCTKRDHVLPAGNTNYQCKHQRTESAHSCETLNLYAEPVIILGVGLFRNAGDNHAVLTRESYNKEENKDSSFSYTYVNLYCRVCKYPQTILSKNTIPVFVKL